MVEGSGTASTAIIRIGGAIGNEPSQGMLLMSLNRRKHGGCWHSEQCAELDLVSGFSNARIGAVHSSLEIATLNNQATQPKFGSLIGTFSDIACVSISGYVLENSSIKTNMRATCTICR